MSTIYESCSRCGVSMGLHILPDEFEDEPETRPQLKCNDCKRDAELVKDIRDMLLDIMDGWRPIDRQP